jgi:hypothetical protein
MLNCRTNGHGYDTCIILVVFVSRRHHFKSNVLCVMVRLFPAIVDVVMLGSDKGNLAVTLDASGNDRS